MEIILLERVVNLGQMGDKVTVRPGYARNHLLPKGKALRATKANIELFATQKKQLEAENLTRKSEAEKVSSKMDNLEVIIIRQAGEAGQLYGSVTANDISTAVTAAGVTIKKHQVSIDHPIKTLGIFEVTIVLHPEVTRRIRVNVARSEEEAKLQQKTGAALLKTDLEEITVSADDLLETPLTAEDEQL